MQKNLLLVFALLFCNKAQAIQNQSWYVGASYYSQNSLFKTTTSDSATANILGAPFYPLGISYTTDLWGYTFAPKLDYTLMPRKAAGDSADETLMVITLPFGSNLNESWDWTAGPAIARYTLKGAGGIKTLSNGTGTADFAQPGRSVTATTIAVHAGVAYNTPSWRFDLGTNINGILSDKRALDLYLAFQYKL